VVLVVLMATTAAAQETREQRAELRFLEGMIDHHQMALGMANDCLTKAETETVRTLCGNIIVAQSAEIMQMQSWLRDWYGVEYAPMPMTAEAESHTGHDMAGMDMPESDMSLSDDPAMTMGMMAGLNRLDGRAYEVAWVESMIDHHDDALHMSERILTRVEHDELRELAEQIITDQTAEIALMEDLLEQFSAE
jgi:uncharacterized protein (DUF305 family)